MTTIQISLLTRHSGTTPKQPHPLPRTGKPSWSRPAQIARIQRCEHHSSTGPTTQQTSTQLQPQQRGQPEHDTKWHTSNLTQCQRLQTTTHGRHATVLGKLRGVGGGVDTEIDNRYWQMPFNAKQETRLKVFQ